MYLKDSMKVQSLGLGLDHEAEFLDFGLGNEDQVHSYGMDLALEFQGQKQGQGLVKT